MSQTLDCPASAHALVGHGDEHAPFLGWRETWAGPWQRVQRSQSSVGVDSVVSSGAPVEHLAVPRDADAAVSWPRRGQRLSTCHHKSHSVRRMVGEGGGGGPWLLGRV